MTILDRTLKLIGLSSSSNENEARSAAFQACALIREHRMIVRERALADDLEEKREKTEKAKEKARAARQSRGERDDGAVCGVDGIWRGVREPGRPSQGATALATPPFIHLSESGFDTLCGTSLSDGVNYFWIDKVSLRRGVRLCIECVKMRS